MSAHDGPRVRSERRLAVLLALVGAGLGLLAASRTWVGAEVTDDLAGRLSLTASGREAAPVVPAVSLVALAAAVAVMIGRWVGRLLAGALLVLAGAAAVASAVSVSRSPRGAIVADLTRATGRTGDAGAATELTVSGWPWVAVAGGLLALVAGVLVVLRARSWTAPSARFDPEPAPARTTAAQQPAGPVDAADSDAGQAWDALTRGEDPT